MLKTLGETISLIESGHLLHISASVPLLKKLPKGNWIAGSTEFFLTPEGGLNSDDVLEVYSLPFNTYKICDYDADTLDNLTVDAYGHGFSLIIIPAKSDIFMAYAKYALNNKELEGKNVAGWVSGAASVHSNSKTLPIAANGRSTDSFFSDRAVALHISLPPEQKARIGIINIFSPRENGSVITFKTENADTGDIVVENCFIDGMERNLAEYMNEQKLSNRAPLIADCMEGGVNVSVDKIKDGKVLLCAPVFENINYRFSCDVDDYAEEFRKRIGKYKDRSFVFSCNCVLNYIFGELDGKDLGGFYGPVCYGEIACRLLTQTLVYIEVK